MRMGLLQRIIGAFLGSGKHAYSEAEISADIARDVMLFAHKAHPKEFSAYLRGRIEGGVLRIDGINYQHFFADEDHAVVYDNLPLLSDTVGFVHSHPSGALRPSREDLRSFAKEGVFHLIVGPRGRYYAFAGFDGRGRRVKCRIA